MRRETDKLLRAMQEEEARRRADIRKLQAAWENVKKAYEKQMRAVEALRAKMIYREKPEPTLHEMLADIDTP